MPNVVGITHNDFQDNPSGSEQGGQDYGLIAGNITANFSNAAGSPTWEAYVATRHDVRAALGQGQHTLLLYQVLKWHVGCNTLSRAIG